MRTIHKIFFQNASEMKEIQDTSVDLMITSPPYPMIEMWDDIFSKQINFRSSFLFSLSRSFSVKMTSSRYCSIANIKPINGKAFSNSSFLRGNRLCRSKRQAIGLKKVSVNPPYKISAIPSETCGTICMQSRKSIGIIL
jgi:DNA modification methylase